MKNSGKTVAATTLGCKVNFYDTEAMLELFAGQGYKIVDFSEAADIYIINTCTVTNLGDKKSRQMIRRAKKQNPTAVIAAVGCLSQVAPDEVAKIEGISLILGTKDRKEIVRLIESYKSENGVINAVSDVSHETCFEPLSVNTLADRCRAYLKIQEGCDRFCTYCIIPYARGPVRSRPEADVIAEVRKLAENGYKEIVFAGIHVASYGKDLKTTNLLQVLRLAHEIKGIKRIRLSSVEPLLITEEFVSAVKNMPKICRHFHLSLQSGCDKTLKAMNRKYDCGQFRQAAELLRRHLPGVSITTDIIVGFPGETDVDFLESYNFVKETELSRLHIFPYSRKIGTPAAEYENQVPSAIKTERAKRFSELDGQLRQNFVKSFVGKRLDVLYEKKIGEDLCEGLSDNYITVITKSEKNLIKEILSVKIERTEGFSAVGRADV